MAKLACPPAAAAAAGRYDDLVGQPGEASCCVSPSASARRWGLAMAQ